MTPTAENPIQAIRAYAEIARAKRAEVYPNDCHLCGPRLADQDGDCPNPNCPLKSTPVAEE